MSVSRVVGLCFGCLYLVTHEVSFAQSGSNFDYRDFSSIEADIQKEVASGKMPSASIGVYSKGKVIWEYSFGFADKENRILSTVKTPYYLASVTKSLISTATMLLVERDKIKLTDPVNNYLRSAKVTSPWWDVREVTLERIMTHTSGITTFDRCCFEDEPKCEFSFEQTISRYGIVVWPPGDHYDYSNLNYGIMGQVIKEASQKELGAFLKEEIFEPLGMTTTYLGFHENENIRPAIGYTSGGKQSKLVAALEARGAYGSVHDLL